jgi:hypothetical protein
MKLLASGWSRHISTRKLFELELSEARDGDKYEWTGLTVQRIKKVEEIRYFNDADVTDGTPPALGYRFRMHIGESTMGGDYSADLLVNSDDVLAMFKQIFGHLTVDEILALLNEKQHQM